MTNIKPGDQIPLTLQLADEDAGAYPRATVLDAVGNEISGSPVALSHVAAGLYTNAALVMPTTARIYAQYRVFQDAGFTTRHPIHSDTLLDVFERDTLSEKVDALLEGAGSLGDITGFVEDVPQLLVGSLEDSGGLFGLVDDDAGLVGFVAPADSLTGYMMTGEELTGIVVDC